MKVYSYGNDYAYQQRKSKETQPIVPAPKEPAPQNKETDDKNQVPAGGRGEMENSPQKESEDSVSSETQESETPKKKATNKKVDKVAD